MKITPYAIRTVVAAGALVLVSSGAANAQLLDNMKFTTSFPFMIGKQQLPAGAYTVTPLPQDNALLQISNGHDSVLVLTENESPRVQPKHDEVTFIKRGDTYIMRGIWDSGTISGVELLPASNGHAHHVKAER
jgi:hypothetical protein